ncbi:MAG: hypothetical protein VB106_17895 [Clostridiaceae bacterium]|jgi:hypothetical protein|nr:hypothetical protein [Clostridiaceae bacterium]
MQRTAIFTFILLMVLIGSIYLQILLSRKESKWFGLILPAIFFLCSFNILFNIAVPNSSDLWISIGSGVFGFIVANIPTLLLMMIYFSCREKCKRNKELQKMNVQDLE